MNILTEKEISNYMDDFDAMTDAKLLKQLECIHNLLDAEDMNKCILFDRAVDLEYLILWECAVRLSYRVQNDEAAEKKNCEKYGYRC